MSQSLHTVRFSGLASLAMAALPMVALAMLAFNLGGAA